MTKILIVDDEKSIRFLLSEVLKKDKYTVDAVSDGSIAIKRLQEESFDLVVTDLHMANKSGIDVLKAGKKHDPLLEVLILTGHGTISSAVKAMQLGAFEYLTKPIDLQEFRLKVKQALERKALRDEIGRQKAELQAQQDMITKDLKLAAQVQDSLVPPSIADKQFSVAVRYSPMIGVGGDFFDIYKSDDQEIYLTIVDVTGHGIAAALLVNRVCMEAKRLVREMFEPAAILCQINDFIMDSFRGTGMFMTMFSCALDLKTGVLRYAGSAHPALVLWKRQSGDFKMLESQNPIIGFEKADPSHFKQDETIMQAGDKLTLYTDGIVEIEDGYNRALGISGLINMFRPIIFLDVNDIADIVMDGLKKYSNAAQRDDIYLITLELK